MPAVTKRARSRKDPGETAADLGAPAGMPQSPEKDVRSPATLPIEVCLFCVHPLLLNEFQRVLAGTDFQVSSRRLENGRVPDAADWAIPAAAVHVVEAHANGQVTMQLIRRVLAEDGNARVMIVKEEFPENEAYPLLSTGGRGLLRYAEVETQLARALQVLAAGGFWVPRLLLSGFVDSVLSSSRPIPAGPLSRDLSPREVEVLELLLRNLSNKEIAKALKISSRTAKFHVSNLLAKHGVGRRADLILLAHASADRGADSRP